MLPSPLFISYSQLPTEQHQSHKKLAGDSHPQWHHSQPAPQPAQLSQIWFTAPYFRHKYALIGSHPHGSTSQGTPYIPCLRRVGATNCGTVPEAAAWAQAAESMLPPFAAGSLTTSSGSSHSTIIPTSPCPVSEERDTSTWMQERNLFYL